MDEVGAREPKAPSQRCPQPKVLDERHGDRQPEQGEPHETGQDERGRQERDGREHEDADGVRAERGALAQRSPRHERAGGDEPGRHEDDRDGDDEQARFGR